MVLLRVTIILVSYVLGSVRVNGKKKRTFFNNSSNSFVDAQGYQRFQQQRRHHNMNDENNNMTTDDETNDDNTIPDNPPVSKMTPKDNPVSKLKSGSTTKSEAFANTLE
jgi:hypothetical protein